MCIVFSRIILVLFLVFNGLTGWKVRSFDAWLWCLYFGAHQHDGTYVWQMNRWLRSWAGVRALVIQTFSSCMALMYQLRSFSTRDSRWSWSDFWSVGTDSISKCAVWVPIPSRPVEMRTFFEESMALEGPVWRELNRQVGWISQFDKGLARILLNKHEETASLGLWRGTFEE